MRASRGAGVSKPSERTSVALIPATRRRSLGNPLRESREFLPYLVPAGGESFGPKSWRGGALRPARRPLCGRPGERRSSRGIRLLGCIRKPTTLQASALDKGTTQRSGEDSSRRIVFGTPAQTVTPRTWAIRHRASEERGTQHGRIGKTIFAVTLHLRATASVCACGACRAGCTRVVAAKSGIVL